MGGGRDVQAVAVAADALALLPGTGFADAYRVGVGGDLTAPQLAEMLFADSPAWVGWLMALRDRVMGAFGVKPAGNGPFPVVSSDARQVVLGYDDSHLDFRLLVEVDGPVLTVTTLVRLNNLMGRGYLAAIMPFHRLIARTMLANVARRLAVGP